LLARTTRSISSRNSLGNGQSNVEVRSTTIEDDLPDYRDPEESSLPITDPLILINEVPAPTHQQPLATDFEEDPAGFAADTSAVNTTVGSTDRDVQPSDEAIMRDVDDILQRSGDMNTSQQTNKRGNRPGATIRDYFGPRKSMALNLAATMNLPR